jgi:hypothetical protein
MVDLPDVRARDAEGLSRHFRYFGEVETPKMDAGTYTVLSLEIAEDEALLAMAQEIDPGQPAPNVFYAAVQDLLLEDAGRSPAARALSRFYPAVSGKPIPSESPWPFFREFCLTHANVLLPKFRNGRTQTCVVHRCAIVLPALASLPRVAEAGGRVGLLEIGPSAGLNLRLDRYRYEYEGEDGARVVWGDPAAKPVLKCEARGGALPPVPTELEVLSRRGLDLNAIDLGDPLALRWLRALIWPEHVLRARLMDEALAHVPQVPIEIVEGDATREIAEQIAMLPLDVPRVVFATHVVYQIPREGLLALLDGVAEASRPAPVDFIIMESSGKGDSRVDHFAFEAGERKSRTLLARADSHGRWIEWGGKP